MNLSTIERLQGAHHGEHAWLFGKGPSLDAFDMSSAGSLRICINESAKRVPQATYVFAHDEAPIQRFAEVFPQGCTAVLEPPRALFALQCGIPADKIVTYTKRPIPRQDRESDAPLPPCEPFDLIGLSGTVHSAIHFCERIGVIAVSLVGFDGAGGYAESLQLESPLGGGQHHRIRKDSAWLLEKLGMKFEFVDPPQNKDPIRVDYETLYDTLRASGYHAHEDNSSHLAPYIPWIVDKLRIQTALDIGCSAGMSLELLGRAGIRACGVDVSQQAVNKGVGLGRRIQQASATHLPFDDASFDLVCSADVFEHLAPQDVPTACSEAARVAKKYLFFKIAEHEDTTQQWKELAGHPLHLTTRPIEWWKEQFQGVGRVIRQERELICIEKS